MLAQNIQMVQIPMQQAGGQKMVMQQVGGRQVVMQPMKGQQVMAQLITGQQGVGYAVMHQNGQNPSDLEYLVTATQHENQAPPAYDTASGDAPNTFT